MIEPKVSVIILNYNGKHFLKDCLDSALDQTYPNHEVIVVDNDSSDGSVGFVEENYPEVTLIKNTDNLGYAEGNNVGIRKALEDPHVEYVILLNNDTKVKSDWLAELVRVAEEEKAGMVGSKILFWNGKFIDSVGLIMWKEGESGDRGSGEPANRYNQKIEIFGPCGAAALYSRELLEDVGMDGDYLDSDFFMYGEDTDLTLRARLLGYRCFYSPQAVVYHKGGGSAGKGSPLSNYYGRRNRTNSLIKNYPTSLLLKYLPRILLKEIALVGYALARGELIVTLKAKLDFMKGLRKMLGKRYMIQARKRVSDKEIEKWLEDYPWFEKLRKL